MNYLKLKVKKSWIYNKKYIRELKHATFLSTRTTTGSDFAKKLTSHVTDVKSQISKLPILRLW